MFGVLCVHPLDGEGRIVCLTVMYRASSLHLSREAREGIPTMYLCKFHLTNLDVSTWELEEEVAYEALPYCIFFLFRVS